MKEFAIFWGCTIPSRFPFLEKSIRMVLDGFDLPYRDLDGFTCCPEKSLVNNVDRGLWVLTAARNIALLDKAHLDLVSPCTGCASNLSTVNSELHLNLKDKELVNNCLKKVDLEFKGENKLRHLVPFFHDEVGISKIKNKIVKPFNGMRIAVHYGCHMIRPSHALKNDDPLDPKKFDNLIRAMGAESVQYTSKLLCCGQGLDRVDQHENALYFARMKLKELKALYVDAMAVSCPSCYLQFDNNQFLMEKEGEKFGIPILYFSELMGLAIGYKPDELGLDSHRSDVTKFIEKWEKLNEEKSRAADVNREMEEGFGISQP